MVWDRLPRSPSGKADRSSLRDASLAPIAEPVAATNDVQRALLDAANAALGRQDFGIDTTWFEAQGDSIRALRFLALLQERYQWVIPLDVFLDSPTVRELETWLKESGASVEGRLNIEGD